MTTQPDGPCPTCGTPADVYRRCVRPFVTFRTIPGGGIQQMCPDDWHKEVPDA